MAVGTVSGANTDDIWQLIATNTPSAASTTSFTSISGYKKLMITWELSATSEKLGLRFNNDSTTNYSFVALMYSGYQNRSYDTYIGISGYNDSPTAGYVVFKDTDKTTPKFGEDAGGMSITMVKGIYFGTSAITRVDVFPITGTFTGTIKLYGIAA